MPNICVLRSRAASQIVNVTLDIAASRAEAAIANACSGVAAQGKGQVPRGVWGERCQLTYVVVYHYVKITGMMWQRQRVIIKTKLNG